jgi:hypothetical protein
LGRRPASGPLAQASPACLRTCPLPTLNPAHVHRTFPRGTHSLASQSTLCSATLATWSSSTGRGGRRRRRCTLTGSCSPPRPGLTLRPHPALLSLSLKPFPEHSATSATAFHRRRAIFARFRLASRPLVAAPPRRALFRANHLGKLAGPPGMRRLPLRGWEHRRGLHGQPRNHPLLLLRCASTGSACTPRNPRAPCLASPRSMSA